MPVRERIRVCLGAWRRDERGIAVPTALMALVACFALASVAVMSSVDVQQGTNRDHESKEAIAAADAGANIALLRLNRFLPSLSVANPCVGPSGEALPESGGWCPSTTAEPVGSAVYSYRVSAFGESGEIDIVSVGSAGAVSRRVTVALTSASGKEVFLNEKLIGQDEITLEGNSEINTDIGTNGNILVNGSPTLCGNDRHGPGKEGPDPDCDGEKSEGYKDLPPVPVPANIETVNDNCRLAQNCSDHEKVDTYSKKTSKTDPWDATKRIINVGSSSTLTMGGFDYWVCGLFINAGKIIMPVGADVRIFVDTPEHCGLKSGATQVEIKGNANIESTALNSQQGLFDVPGIYLLGNGAVNLAGTSGTNELMLYAPYSTIDIGGNATWKGMIAGKTLKIHGGPIVESDPNIKEPDLTFPSIFERSRYVECTGASASPPNANC